jgi:hypothetical protein
MDDIYEEQLRLALKESTREAERKNNNIPNTTEINLQNEEDEQLQRALKESLLTNLPTIALPKYPQVLQALPVENDLQDANIDRISRNDVDLDFALAISLSEELNKNDNKKNIDSGILPDLQPSSSSNITQDKPTESNLPWWNRIFSSSASNTTGSKSSINQTGALRNPKSNNINTDNGLDIDDILLREMLLLSSQEDTNPSINSIPNKITSSNNNTQITKQNNSNTSQRKQPRECPRCKQTVSAFSYITFGKDEYYHSECFRCFGCNESLPISGKCSVHEGLPYHLQCAQQLFYSPTCVLCNDPINGRHYSHGFFKDFKYCAKHVDANHISNPICGKCFSCHKREPFPESNRAPFVQLLDGRKLCPHCQSTVVMESAELQVIYPKILKFFSEQLGFILPPEIYSVPILAVDVHTLNENMNYEYSGNTNGHGHCGGLDFNHDHQAVTMGLTMSTIQHRTRHIPHMVQLHSGTANFGHRSWVEPVIYTIPETEVSRKVTAILVLFGLPHDLCASILAHETMHAYLRLTREMPEALPSMVEEGLCQLVAYKYLEYLSAASNADTDGRRNNINEYESKEDELYRQFFRYNIENDSSEVYGAGFRRARVCEEQLSLQVLLEYIGENQLFPGI